MNKEKIKDKICKNCKSHFVEEISFDYPQSCCHISKGHARTTEPFLSCDNFEYSNEYIKDLQKKAEQGDHYKKLYGEIKKQKDDVVEYIKKHIQEYDIDGSPTNLDEFDFLASPKTLLRMLGEIDVKD